MNFGSCLVSRGFGFVGHWGGLLGELDTVIMGERPHDYDFVGYWDSLLV